MLKNLREYIIVFLIAMVPVLELRGAIPFGIGMGLRARYTFIVAILGNSLIVPFLIFFLKKALEWASTLPKVGRYCQRIIDRAVAKSQNIGKYEILGLFLFVAIPLPGTGAWTGSLVATILQIPPRKSIPTIIAGVVAAGIIMSFASKGVFGALSHLFSW